MRLPVLGADKARERAGTVAAQTASLGPWIKQPQAASNSASPLFCAEPGARLREVHHVLDAFRAVLALISMLLVPGLQVEHAAALELATQAFGVYAALSLMLCFYGVRLAQHAAVHWVDALWCLLFFALADGSNGFFTLLFFPVLFAAARAGLFHSVGIATACAAGAAVILSTHVGEIPWLRVVIMPAALLVLGPMAALLAHVEAQARQGDSFAAELIGALDARRGVEAIVRTVLTMTLPRFACDVAVLALQTRDGSVRMFQCGADGRSEELPRAAVATVTADLLALAQQRGLCFTSSCGWAGHARYSTFDTRTGAGSRMRKAIQAFATLATLADRHHAVLVPAGQCGATVVWLLFGRDRHPFGRDLQLTLHHIVEQIVPVIDNATLLEQLVAATAETERARIGRDLHDSAIQPYVGLKFAIEALARRVPDDSPLAHDVHALAKMANQELQSLREMVSGLRGAHGSGDALLEQAVRRQAARFAALFGMQVDVTTEGDLPVSRRLSGELFHLVSEGLANVRRHTRARRAAVTLAGGRELTLTIANEAVPGAPVPAAFQPRSLAERAAELGGSATVHIDARGTTVQVRLPWPQEATT